MASIQCPHCGAKLNVPDAALGKSGRCPKCQEKFLLQVPNPVDKYDLAPLDGPAPFTPAPQPLPSAAKPLGPAMAVPSQAAARPVAKGQKQEDDSDGFGNKQVLLLAGGGMLALFVLVGGLAYLFT